MKILKTFVLLQTTFLVSPLPAKEALTSFDQERTFKNEKKL